MGTQVYYCVDLTKHIVRSAVDGGSQDFVQDLDVSGVLPEINGKGASVAETPKPAPGVRIEDGGSVAQVEENGERKQA